MFFFFFFLSLSSHLEWKPDEGKITLRKPLFFYYYTLSTLRIVGVQQMVFEWVIEWINDWVTIIKTFL